jgi:membrane associated rhomboid family serine protease
MIPLTVDVPMKRLPWANWGLILATVVVSLAVPASRREVSISPRPAHGDQSSSGLTVHERLSPLVLQREHFAPYQLITALFQHAGWLHLIGNMVFLFVFGNAINAKLGHLGFLAAYLGIGALEGLIWLAVGSAPACLGASAAIMGLCGMFLVLYPRNTVQVFWDDFLIFWASGRWTWEIPGWAAVLLYLVFDVWGALFDQDAGIGYVSHIIGGLLGVALAMGLLLTGLLTPDEGEQTLLQCVAGEGPVERAEEDRPRERTRLRPRPLRPRR